MVSAFHITRIENLQAIWAAGELKCDDDADCLANRPHSFAYQDIKARRRQTIVQAGPGGRLSAYVPFYFSSRSPMLATVFYRDRDTGGRDQERIVHLRVDVRAIEADGLPIAFTNGHGIMAITQFYDDLADLARVDWDVIRSNYWSDTVDDPDRKRRKQAEFLVHRCLPIRHIIEVGVKTAKAKQEVEFLLAGEQVQPPVTVRPEWYYL